MGNSLLRCYDNFLLESDLRVDFSLLDPPPPLSNSVFSLFFEVSSFRLHQFGEATVGTVTQLI